MIKRIRFCPQLFTKIVRHASTAYGRNLKLRMQVFLKFRIRLKDIQVERETPDFRAFFLIWEKGREISHPFRNVELCRTFFEEISENSVYNSIKHRPACKGQRKDYFFSHVTVMLFFHSSEWMHIFRTAQTGGRKWDMLPVRKTSPADTAIFPTGHFQQLRCWPGKKHPVYGCVLYMNRGGLRYV